MIKPTITVLFFIFFLVTNYAYGGKYAIHDAEPDVFVSDDFARNNDVFSVTVKLISQDNDSFLIEHDNEYSTFVKAGKPKCFKTPPNGGPTEEIDFQACLSIFKNTKSAICDAQFIKKDKTLGSIYLTHTHNIDNIKTTLIFPLKMDLTY